MSRTRKCGTKAKTGKTSVKVATTKGGLEVSRLMSQLGATESFPVNVSSDGAFGARALAAEISSATAEQGRSSIRSWGEYAPSGAYEERSVASVEERSSAASGYDRRISARQLAALLLEKHVLGSGGKL